MQLDILEQAQQFANLETARKTTAILAACCAAITIVALVVFGLIATGVIAAPAIAFTTALWSVVGSSTLTLIFAIASPSIEAAMTNKARNMMFNAFRP